MACPFPSANWVSCVDFTKGYAACFKPPIHYFRSYLDGKLKSVWKNKINIGSAVPKLSTTSGLLYFYELDRSDGRYRWSLTGLDVNDGKTLRFKYTAFSNAKYVRSCDSAWGTMALTDGGVAVAAWRGMRWFQDA